MKKTPCNDCPFRKDSLIGWLGQKRAEQIAANIYEHDITFQCHKTLEKGNTNGVEELCAGAIILDAKQNNSTMEKPIFSNKMHRLMKLLFPDLEIKNEKVIFETIQDFVKHHS